MPVEIINQKGTKRLRFTRNTSYNGVDYGPDYPLQVADVATRWAFQFIANGRAEEITAATDEAPKDETPKEETPKSEANPTGLTTGNTPTVKNKGK